MMMPKPINFPGFMMWGRVLRSTGGVASAERQESGGWIPRAPDWGEVRVYLSERLASGGA
jgi:hypothetical protein